MNKIVGLSVDYHTEDKMKNSNKGKRKILVTTIVAIMLAITISILPVFGWLSNVERILEDRMYQTDVNLKETIKIIAIDEASLLVFSVDIR